MVSVHASSSRSARVPTISSLHIGHTSLLEALAAAFCVSPRRTLLLMSSLVSAVLAGLFDVCELKDTELSEGDSRLALRRCWAAGCGEMAGDRAGERAGERFLPLPSTRPPPSDLPEVMIEAVEESRGCPWACRCRRGSPDSVKLTAPGPPNLGPWRRESSAG